MQFAEYGMLKTQLMAVAGLQRIKLAKQKVGKKKKKEAMSALQNHKRLIQNFFLLFAVLQLFYLT